MKNDQIFYRLVWLFVIFKEVKFWGCILRFFPKYGQLTVIQDMCQAFSRSLGDILTELKE